MGNAWCWNSYDNRSNPIAFTFEWRNHTSSVDEILLSIINPIVAMNNASHRKNRHAILRIVAIYALFSSLWIFLSETLLRFFVHDPAIITRIAMSKGLLFILLTAALLYLLISQYIRQLEASERSLQVSEERFRSIFELAPAGVALVDPRHHESIFGMLNKIDTETRPGPPEISE